MVFYLKRAFVVLCAASLLALTACGAKNSDTTSASQTSETTASSIEATDHSSTLPASATEKSESPTTVQSVNEREGMTAPARIEDSEQDGDNPQSAISSSGGSAQSSSKQNAPAKSSSSQNGSSESAKSSSAQSSSKSAQSNAEAADSGSSKPEYAQGGDNAEVNINELY